MTARDLETLRAEFPEIPQWIAERSGITLTQARELMQLRRRAFPKTQQEQGQ